MHVDYASGSLNRTPKKSGALFKEINRTGYVPYIPEAAKAAAAALRPALLALAATLAALAARWLH